MNDCHGLPTAAHAAKRAKGLPSRFRYRIPASRQKGHLVKFPQRIRWNWSTVAFHDRPEMLSLGGILSATGNSLVVLSLGFAAVTIAEKCFVRIINHDGSGVAKIVGPAVSSVGRWRSPVGVFSRCSDVIGCRPFRFDWKRLMRAWELSRFDRTPSSTDPGRTPLQRSVLRDWSATAWNSCTIERATRTIGKGLNADSYPKSVRQLEGRCSLPKFSAQWFVDESIINAHRS